MYLIHCPIFMDTAYFVDKMDAIFTVDTSLVHLSGTMNKKTFFYFFRLFQITDGLE